MQKNFTGVKYLIILFILFSPLSAHSQDFRFEHIASKDGLAGNSVSAILQDKRGFLWFATQDGLNRYDGREYALYEHIPFDNSSLPHNLIQTMYYDYDKDIIWVGTYGGLCTFNPRDDIITPFSLGDSEGKNLNSSRVIVSIEKNADGKMWIGTLDGLIKLDPETGVTTEYRNSADDPFSLPDNCVRDLMLDSKGVLWVATYNGLSFVRGDKFIKVAEDGFSSRYIMDIEEVSSGLFLVGTWDGGISLYNSIDKTVKNVSLPDNRIYFVKKDSRGHIWTGTWGGGIYFADNYELFLKSRYREIKADKGNSYSLSSNIAYSFFNDTSGLIWIGTNGGGVNKLNPAVKDYRYIYNNPEKEKTLPSDRIKSLMNYQDKELWIGTYSSGLYRYDIKSGQLAAFTHDSRNPFSISNNSVNKIFLDSRDDIWVATNLGVNRFIPGKQGFEQYIIDDGNVKRVSGKREPGGDPKNAIVYSMFEDIKGRLWFGTYLNGIFIWDRNSGKTIHISSEGQEGHRLSNQIVYVIEADRDNNIWIGTNYGLSRYDMETENISLFFHDPENQSGISNNVVNRIFRDFSGNMWFGTSGGGLSRFDYNTESFRHYLKKDGLFNNSVNGISEDRRGNILVTTNKGISILDVRQDRIYDITYQFGLNDIEIKGDICRDGSGNFYISAHGAIYLIDTENYYIHDYNPEVLISDMKVFNKPYFKEKGGNIFDSDYVKLGWDENFISFSFIALDYSAPLNNSYKYILDGFDKDWVYAGNRNFVSYTNLPSGEYVFRVKGTNSSGIWSSDESSIKIKISPPPLRSIYAYIIYLLFIFLAVYSLVMIIRGRESERRLQEENILKNELIQANSRLDRLVRIDTLTGVHNRLHFNEVFGTAWNLHERLNITFSILMADIDFFKKYNDTYGHVAGDSCLKNFAEVLLEAVSRKTDSVFRYGGEEFIIILLDTGLDGAAVVAEKIREKLSIRRIKHESSDIEKYITASIGISTTDRVNYKSAEEMLLDVDRKLYKAKEHGRNTVIC